MDKTTRVMFHRHALAFVSLEDYPALPEDAYGQKIMPFRYCERCGTVPRWSFGRDPTMAPKADG